MRRGAVLFAGLSLLALALASVADAASVSPDSMDFGSQAVGTAGSAATFTLTASANFCTNYVFPTCMSTTNYQTDTTALGGGPGTTTTSGDFVIHNDSCPSPLTSPPSPGPFFGTANSCQFEASFLPTAGGALTKTLIFPDTNPNPSTGTLTLTGTGVVAPASATPTATPTVTTPHKKCKKKRHHAVAAKKCKRKRR